MSKQSRSTGKKDSILHKRRILVTVLLIAMAGFGTLAAFVLTDRAKADISYDPFFTISTGPAKVRIFEPLEKSVGNEQSFTASGTAPAFSTVSISVDGVFKSTATANESGLWSKTISGVGNGDHTLQAQATLAGPFSVVSATQFIPGYSIVDLSTNGFVSSSVAGFGVGLYALTGSGQDLIDQNNSIKISDETVYLLRPRSITVVDVAAQKGIKTITFANQFLSNDDPSADTGETLRDYKLSADGTRLYVLFSNENRSKIVAFNTTTHTVISETPFPAESVANATDMILTNNETEIYIGAEYSDQLGLVNVQSGDSSTIQLPTSLRAIDVSPNGSTIYIARVCDFENCYISKFDPVTKVLDANAITLGPSAEASRLYAPKKADKLYVGSSARNEIRVFNGASAQQEAVVELGDLEWENENLIAENTTGSRIYIGTTEGNIAVVDHDTDSLASRINKPGQNYTGPNSLMLHNNRVYISYNRSPGQDDLLSLVTPTGNPSRLYSSLAFADANTSSTVSATPIVVNGAASGVISQPVAVNPITLSNSTNFSVGQPITITGPTDDPLTTSTPVITGKGPKNSQIQLSINGASPQDVSVNNNGDWSSQVTLPKNRSSTIGAVYANKRTQLVIPNTFIFGADIAKNQLSVIDGASGLQQKPITLPPINLTNIKLNTSATVSPSGNRYYVANVDATQFVTENLQLAISGDTEAALGTLPSLLEEDLGYIDVYSTQTKQITARIPIGKGKLPLSMAISPDGKRGIITSFDIGKQIALLQFEGEFNDSVESPLGYTRVNLDTNEVVGNDISTQIDLTFFNDTANASPQKIANFISGIINTLTKPGVFSADSNKIYVPSFSAEGIGIIDFASAEKTNIAIPGNGTVRAILGIQINRSTNELFFTYLEADIPDENTAPSFSTGFQVINLTNNQFSPKVPLSGIPLFNFAISSNGSKIYMTVLQLEDLINFASTTIENPQGIVFDSLPSFKLGIYDRSVGSYTTRDITRTEIPYNLVLSPDDSKVFIPTLLQNVVHVYDVQSGEMNAGNAPIILDGISTSLATTQNIGEYTLGTYNDSQNFYVPPDAPGGCVGDDCPCTGDNCNKVINNTITQFRYLPSSGSGGVQLTADQLRVPEQTVRVVKQSAQAALNSPENIKREVIARSWLVYFIYGAFISILGLTGYTVWKTDMLIGSSDDENYV